MNTVFQLAIQQLSLEEAREVVAVLESKNSKVEKQTRRQKQINELKKLFK
ncbi:hypothetical protein [Salegentibacter sp. UBA1130]|nr:hypothetical protein [Salegentibacter sp. UBA1130]